MYGEIERDVANCEPSLLVGGELKHMPIISSDFEYILNNRNASVLQLNAYHVSFNKYDEFPKVFNKFNQKYDKSPNIGKWNSVKFGDFWSTLAWSNAHSKFETTDRKTLRNESSRKITKLLPNMPIHIKMTSPKFQVILASRSILSGIKTIKTAFRDMIKYENSFDNL